MITRVVALLFLSASICHAQTPATRMDQIVQSFVSDKQFMGSVLVARGDEILLSKGYGSASLEWDIPNTPSTKFRLASLTKQFTAASILLLETRGKLKTEDPVRKYIPEAPAEWDKMTIFHLLTHTSGISRSIGSTTVDKVVAMLRDKPLESQPGERYSYSNAGYVLLGHLIEKISGQTYEKFVQENIFTPLGMKDSGYESQSAVIKRRATGYKPDRNGPENDDHVDILPHAAGVLYSTTEDLLRWHQGLFGGKLLPAASVEKMTTPFKSNYGFGLNIGTVGGKKIISHSGGLEGFDTHLAYYPEDKLTVAVLGNLKGTAPDEIAFMLGTVARGEKVTLLSERIEISLPPDVLRRYVGAYKVPGNDMPLLITLQNNQLSARQGTQNPILLFPQSETRFFVKVMKDGEVEFSGKDAQGRATEVTSYRFGQGQTATRDVETLQKMDDAAAAIAKRFQAQTPMPGSEAALRKLIEEWRNGQPNFDQMGADLAASIRRQVPQLQSVMKEKGAVESITFRGVGPAGADIYHVKFEKNLSEFRIMIGADGKVEMLNFQSINQ